MLKEGDFLKFFISLAFATLSLIAAWIVSSFLEPQFPVLVAIITFWGVALYQKLESIHDLLQDKRTPPPL